MDISNYSRIIGLLIALHIICLIIEAYRYKNSHWNCNDTFMGISTFNIMNDLCGGNRTSE